MPSDATKNSSVPSSEKSDVLFSSTTKVNIILLCVGLLLVAMLWLTEFLTSVVVMLAATLVLTYLLLGPVRFLETGLHMALPKSRRLPASLRRTLAIICVYVLCFGCFTLVFIRVLPPLTLELKEFAHDLPAYLSKWETQAGNNPAARHSMALPHPLSQWMKPSVVSQKQASTPRASTTSPSAEARSKSSATPADAHSRSSLSITSKTPGQAQLLSTTTRLAVQKLIDLYRQYAADFGNFLLDLGTTTLSGLVYMLTTLVLAFYLLHDGKGLKEGFINLMPTRSEAWMNRFLHRVHIHFYSIVKGQVLMSLLSGSVIYLVLVMLDIKYALLLGVLFGCVSIIPVIGPWLGLLPISFVLILRNHSMDVIQVMMVAGLFYLVKTYWLWPQVVQRKFNIHPVLFLITFLACLKVVGYLGILLSFPLASVFGVALDMLKAAHRDEQKTTSVLSSIS